MKYIVLLLTITLPNIASADWYYLDFREDAKKQVSMCSELGAQVTPQDSLGHHVGRNNFEVHASYTFSDRSEMLTLSTENAIYVYANSLTTCKALRDSLNGTSREEVFIAGMCDKPKRTGTMEMEIASSLVKHGSARLKIGMQNKWGALLELALDDGRIAPISLSNTKENCLAIAEAFNKPNANQNSNWYVINQGRNKCIISPMSPASRIEFIQNAGLKPSIHESKRRGNILAVDVSVIDGGSESKWVFWRDKATCESTLNRTEIPDSYR